MKKLTKEQMDSRDEYRKYFKRIIKSNYYNLKGIIRSDSDYVTLIQFIKHKETRISIDKLEYIRNEFIKVENFDLHSM